MSRLTAPILGYIAADVCRRRYGDDEKAAARLRRTVQRKFKVAISEARMQTLHERYHQIYGDGEKKLSEFLTPPPRGKYSDSKDVDIPGFVGALRRKHPREPIAVVNVVALYVILYEYLR